MVPLQSTQLQCLPRYIERLATRSLSSPPSPFSRVVAQSSGLTNSNLTAIQVKLTPFHSKHPHLTLTMPTRNQLIATSVAVGLVGGFVGYAAWFDYKRRNDEGFRRQLSEFFWQGVGRGWEGGSMPWMIGGDVSEERNSE